MASSLRLILALAAGVAMPAVAQTMMDTSTIDLGIQQIQQDSMLFQSMNSANALSSSSSGAREPRSRDGSRGQPPARITQGATATTFRSVAPSLAPHQLAVELGENAGRRQRLEYYFSENLKNYRDLLRQRGGPPNDVARSASFLVATCYDILHPEHEFNEAEMTVLRAQMGRALPQDARFQTYDDRRKQEAFERFAIFGMHLGGVQLRAQETHDEALMREVRRMASEQLEDMFGVPAARIRFARDGLHF